MGKLEYLIAWVSSITLLWVGGWAKAEPLCRTGVAQGEQDRLTSNLPFGQRVAVAGIELRSASADMFSFSWRTSVL